MKTQTQEIIKTIANDHSVLEQMLKAAPTSHKQASYSNETYYEVPNNAFYRDLVKELPYTNYGWSHFVPQHEYPGDYGHCECETTMETHIIEYNSFGSKTEERLGSKCPKTFEMNYSYGIGD